MKTESISNPLNNWFPRRGSCVCCGGPDARHRLFDAIVSRYEAGESVEALAADYAVTVTAIEAVTDWWD